MNNVLKITLTAALTIIGGAALFAVMQSVASSMYDYREDYEIQKLRTERIHTYYKHIYNNNEK
jgi:hypothetical protein